MGRGADLLAYKGGKELSGSTQFWNNKENKRKREINHHQKIFNETQKTNF